MSIETLKTISVIAYSISGGFLLLTIVLFFKLNIMEILGEITGITRRRAIRDLGSKSSEEQQSFYNPSYLRGRSTGKVTGRTTGRMTGKTTGRTTGRFADKFTGKIGGKTGRDTSGRLNGLSGRINREPGNSSEFEAPETTILTKDEIGQTEVLTPEMKSDNVRMSGSVKVVTEIIMCESDEVIE